MLITKLRNYLSENNLDYLLINTTDEFLVEYNEPSNCARNIVTGFSGSTGDALLSKDNLWQFVDGRYHEQADKEVDLNKVTVVKQQMGEAFSDLIIAQIEPGSVFGVVSKKISLNFYKILKKKLSSKKVTVKPLDIDPVEGFAELKCMGCDESVREIDIKITGLSADDKLKKISKKLRKNQIYLETSLENIAYFTNLRQYKTPFSSTFKAKMAIFKDKAVIFTDEKINNKEMTAKNFEIKPLAEFQNFMFPKAQVLFNPSSINYADYRMIKHQRQGQAVELRKNKISQMKAIKNESEIEHFKSSFCRTDKVVSKIEQMIEENDNLNELQLAQEVEKEYLNQGAKQLSFKTILAAGANSSIIHYCQPSKDVKIKDGDFVLLDCGGHFEGGYSTDITRAFVKGAPSLMQKKVYTTVLKMFLNAYHHKITTRTTGHTLDRIARKIAKKSGLMEQCEGFNFNHGLGHGVGINVHEAPPVISSGKFGKTFLKENMVFTIEPGLYCKDFGGVRLENTVYLRKKNGELVLESLSKAKFQEKCVDFDLLNEQEKKWFSDWQNG